VNVSHRHQHRHFLGVLAAIAYGVVATFKKRNRVLDAMRAGMAEGSAAPDAATAPRGAGGLTAAQTTAMANNLLNGFPASRTNPLTREAFEVIDKPTEPK
jgi:hypothetical protein